jgi:hypothetical protein
VDAASATTATIETFATVFELGRKSCAIQKFENAPIGDYKRLKVRNVRFGKNSSGVGVRNCSSRVAQALVFLWPVAEERTRLKGDRPQHYLNSTELSPLYL